MSTKCTLSLGGKTLCSNDYHVYIDAFDTWTIHVDLHSAQGVADLHRDVDLHLAGLSREYDFVQKVFSRAWWPLSDSGHEAYAHLSFSVLEWQHMKGGDPTGQLKYYHMSREELVAEAEAYIRETEENASADGTGFYAQHLSLLGPMTVEKYIEDHTPPERQ